MKYWLYKIGGFLLITSLMWGLLIVLYFTNYEAFLACAALSVGFAVLLVTVIGGIVLMEGADKFKK